MGDLFGFLTNGDLLIPDYIKVLIVILAFVILNLFLNQFRRNLLKNVSGRRNKSHVEILTKILKYGLLFVLIIVLLFSISTSLAGLGIVFGLLSAALGFALQRPITGVAAWIMVILKRPFELGDRVIIGNVKGDVTDITLTHVYLNEVGGLYQGEENTGRSVMIPNYQLFEYDIINYSLQDDYVLGQVAVTVTYESDLDKALDIVLEAAKTHTWDFVQKTKKEPYVRVNFEPSGINIFVRYFVSFDVLQETSSEVTKEIFDRIRKTKSVEIAYPHMQLVQPHMQKRSSGRRASRKKKRVIGNN